MTMISMNFMQHISENGLSYATMEEFNFRMARYNIAEDFIQKSNAEAINIGSDLRMGHNQFSTWTEEEYNRLLGFRSTKPIDYKDPRTAFFEL